MAHASDRQKIAGSAVASLFEIRYQPTCEAIYEYISDSESPFFSFYIQTFFVYNRINLFNPFLYIQRISARFFRKGLSRWPDLQNYRYWKVVYIYSKIILYRKIYIPKKLYIPFFIFLHFTAHSRMALSCNSILSQDNIDKRSVYFFCEFHGDLKFIATPLSTSPRVQKDTSQAKGISQHPSPIQNP